MFFRSARAQESAFAQDNLNCLISLDEASMVACESALRRDNITHGVNEWKCALDIVSPDEIDQWLPTVFSPLIYPDY